MLLSVPCSIPYHDLKVRHMKELVYAVAVEAATQLVPHPARRHLVQRDYSHVQRTARLLRLALVLRASQGGGGQAAIK